MFTHRRSSKRASGTKSKSKIGLDPGLAPTSRLSEKSETDESISPQQAASWTVSVEEYFSQGMEEYRLELAKAARKSRKAEKKKQLEDAEKAEPVLARTPSWGLLGDVLNLQLKHMEMITMATQTDWKWQTMAMRWRHGRLIAPSLPHLKRGAIALEHDYERTPPQPASIAPSRTKPKRQHMKAMSLTQTPGLPKWADKCVDTIDLVFNPYDPRLQYTTTKEQKEKFICLRLMLMVLRWRDRMRVRMEEKRREKLLAQQLAKPAKPSKPARPSQPPPVRKKAPSAAVTSAPSKKSSLKESPTRKSSASVSSTRSKGSQHHHGEPLLGELRASLQPLPPIGSASAQKSSAETRGVANATTRSSRRPSYDDDSDYTPPRTNSTESWADDEDKSTRSSVD